MRMFYLCCLLAVTVVVNGDICCFPEKFEFTEVLMPGSISKQGNITQGEAYISFDRTNRRIFMQTDLSTDGVETKLSSLLLYNENIQYIITNGNCTVTDLGPWDQPDCVPDNATLIRTGDLGFGQPLRFTEYFWNILTNDVYVGVTDECFPVYAKTFNMEGYVLSGAIFENITLGIANLAVFDIPEICKTAEKV